MKTLDCRIGRFHWSNLEGINQSNADSAFSNIQDLSSEGHNTVFKKNIEKKMDFDAELRFSMLKIASPIFVLFTK
jgi:hypothetical protein